MKTKPKVNAAWHRQNPMPRNATFEQRVEWHRQHQLHCQCRTGFPEKLMEEMKKRRMKV